MTDRQNSNCPQQVTNGKGHKISVSQKVDMHDEHALLMSQKVILLIEDDLHDVELFRLSLAQIDSTYEVVSVQFAKDAIKYLERVGPYENRNQFPTPALIVLDLTLPGMNGFDFLTWAKCESPEGIPPIIVLSCSPLEINGKLAQRLGAKAYFVKSPLLEETVSTTKELLLAAGPLLPAKPTQRMAH